MSNWANKASLQDLIERLQIEREIREYAQYLNKESSTQVAEKMQQAYASLKQYHYSVFLAHRERHSEKPRTCINSNPTIVTSNKLLKRENGVRVLNDVLRKGLSNGQLEWLSLSFVPSFFGFFLTTSDVDSFFSFLQTDTLQTVDKQHQWQMARSLFYSCNFVQFVSQCFEPILNCAARPTRKDGFIDAMVDSWNRCYDSTCPKAVKRILECDTMDSVALLTCFFHEMFRDPQLFGIVPYCHDDWFPLPDGKESWTDDDSRRFLERKSFDKSAYPLETDQWAPGTDEYSGCYIMMDSIDMNFLDNHVVKFMDRKLYYLSVERTTDPVRSDVQVWRTLESAAPLPIFPASWSVEGVHTWIADKLGNKDLVQDLGAQKMENATEFGLVKKTLHARVCVENIAQEAEKILNSTEMFRAALHVRKGDARNQNQNDKVLQRVASVLTGKHNSYKSFLASRPHLNTYDKALSYVLAKKDTKLRIPENVCDSILQILSDDGDPITKFDAVCKWVVQVKNLHFDAKDVLARTCAYSGRLLPLISNLRFLLRWLAKHDFVSDKGGDQPVFHLVQISTGVLGEVVGQFHIRRIMGTVTMRQCLLVGDQKIIETLMRAVANNGHCPQVCRMMMFSDDSSHGDAVRSGGILLVIYQYQADVRFHFAIALVSPNGESRCSLPKVEGKIPVYQPVPDSSSECAHGDFKIFVTKKEMNNPEIIGDVARCFERDSGGEKSLRLERSDGFA